MAIYVDNLYEFYKESRCVRVDFLGSPGIGKSTLCKAVLEDIDNKSTKFIVDSAKWVSIDHARRIAENNAFNHFIPIMNFRTRFGLLVRLIYHGVGQVLLNGRKVPLSERELDKIQSRLLNIFLKEYHHYFEEIVEQWFDPEMALAPKSVRYYELLQWTKDWLFLTTLASSVRILADNSRYTRGIAELLSNGTCSDNKELADDYCCSPMAPNAVIHLSGDPKLIVERVFLREKSMKGCRHPGHQNLSHSELLEYCHRREGVNKVAVEFFLSRGLPVLSLSASSPIEENVGLVDDFLKTSFAQV